MKTKIFLPILTILSAVLIVGCDSLNVEPSPSLTLSNESSFSTDQNLASGLSSGSLAGVNLGVAGNFVILSETGITDVYKSDITGDVGTSPITGAALLLSCSEVVGTMYTVDAAGPACKVTDATMLTSAIGDMQAAYLNAAGRINPDFIELGAGNIGGLTLTPGLYKWSSALIIPTDIEIAGGPNDVWIFQVAGTLTMASAVNVTLSGGAQAKNIY